jgi:DNA-binding transcriptional LysR family regulator
MIVELRHLRYFVAVADELNYRKASERLHISQPALSRQIRDLEEEIGIKLFERDRSGVSLTDAGSTFLVESRLVLEQAAHAVSAARETEKGRYGRLRVGYLAPLLTGFMPESLRRFRETYPGVEVVLEEMSVADQVEGVESGMLHVGFAIAGHSHIPSSLESRAIVHPRLGALMRRDHRLAKLQRIALSELMREPILCLTVKRGFPIHRDMIKSVLTARGLKIASITSIEGTEPFRAALESGLGISILSEASSLARSRELVFRQLKDTGKDLTLELRAVWRRGENSLLIKNFVDALRK